MKLNARTSLWGAAIGFLFAAAGSAHALSIEVGSPLNLPGLGAGDKFQLVFVTSTRTTREDSPGSGTDNHTIDFWNSYVNTVAGGSSITGLADLTWFAMANTVTTDARDNAVVSSAVYRTDGTLVATGFTDMWDGSIAAPINFNENGVLQTGGGDAMRVWSGGTGYDQSGVKSLSRLLGPGGSTPTNYESTVGNMTQTGGGFTTAWFTDADNFRRGPGTALRFYALSEVISIVPEPATATLSLLAFGGLIMRRRRAA